MDIPYIYYLCGYRSSKSNLTMMIISDLLAVAMLIIVNLLIMTDIVTISSRSVPAGDNVKTASDRYIGDDIDYLPWVTGFGQI